MDQEFRRQQLERAPAAQMYRSLSRTPIEGRHQHTRDHAEASGRKCHFQLCRLRCSRARTRLGRLWHLFRLLCTKNSRKVLSKKRHSDILNGQEALRDTYQLTFVVRLVILCDPWYHNRLAVIMNAGIRLEENKRKRWGLAPGFSDCSSSCQVGT